MGEVGHVLLGEAEALLLRDLPPGGGDLRSLVSLRADRQNNRGDSIRRASVAFLDEASGGGHWVHWGAGLHVHTVQGLHSDL